MGNYYGAGASGLNLNENQYRLDFQGGRREGGPTRILHTVPRIPGLSFTNEVRTGRPGSGDNAYIFGSPYSFERYVRGTIPPGDRVFSIKGSIPDPALYCAQRLQVELETAGLIIRNRASTIQRLNQIPRGNRITFFTHRSPALREIVRETNMNSVNLFAEALSLRQAVKQGQGDSQAKAITSIEDYWQNQGITTKGMYLRDGSGLSANNMISPYQMAAILAAMHRSPHYQNFKQSLPLAGRSGTLKRMLRGTAAEGRLWAKSGFISGVRAYTGYVERADGRILAFAMMANHFSGGSGAMRRKLEGLMARMAE